MRKFMPFVTAALLAAALGASPASAAPPKLLVVIAVDQFSADLFDEYRPRFTAGFARLASGVMFRNGYQAHAATETCPGHAAMLTGDHPARTGVVANSWVDRSIARSDKTVYCAEDETAPGSSSSHYVVSARHLLVPTLGELMKSKWPASRTVAVSGKDRAAVMMSGQTPDQRWYWTGAKFETDLSGARVPAVVGRINAAAAAGLATARPPLDPTPFCASKAMPIRVAGGRTVGNGRLARAAGDQAAFRASTELDGDTLALAAGLIDALALGRGSAPDLLAISLSATDYVGHGYGTEGQEMCLHLTELDRELGDFFAALDSRGVDYEVGLTADHGGKDIPEREREHGAANAARVDPSLSARAIGERVSKTLGQTPGNSPPPGLTGGNSGDIYVDAKLSAAQKRAVIGLALAAYRKAPQVEAVFSASEIVATPLPAGSPDRWSLIERVRAGYYPGRSGDLYVVLKKDVTPIADPGGGAIATHGSPWDYDRRVPILFWRPRTTAAAIERAIDTVDLMPTLAAHVGLAVAPGSIDGHCLAEAADCPAKP